MIASVTGTVGAAGYDPTYGLLSGAILIALLVMTLRRMARALRMPIRRPKLPAPRTDYGLLEPVAIVPTREDAEMLREVLASHGIRATIGLGTAAAPGVQVLVFPSDLRRAREVVAMR